MAKFKPKSFFKKIHAYPLLVELYKRHDITALFELTEQSSRKSVVSTITDFYGSLSIEQKITIDEALQSVASVATVHAEYLFPQILTKRSISSVTTIDCKTKEDLALYYYLFHKDDVFEDCSFFHSFFIKPSYMLYETKKVELNDAEYRLNELTKEYKRILEKESLGKEYTANHGILADKLFYSLTAREVGSSAQELLRVVYLKETSEVILSFTGTKYDKLLLLDTFLRVVCSDGYLEREESYVLDIFKKETFDFNGHKVGTPLISWKIKGVTLVLGTDKAKKTLKVTLPNKHESSGLAPLFSFYKELGLEETATLANLSSVTFSMYFMNEKNKEKSVHVPVSLKHNSATLCPLYPYHAYTRKILKSAGIYTGFVAIAKKEKESITKKWENGM